LSTFIAKQGERLSRYLDIVERNDLGVRGLRFLMAFAGEKDNVARGGAANCQPYGLATIGLGRVLCAGFL
jgi:hypothetical protein